MTKTTTAVPEAITATAATQPAVIVVTDFTNVVYAVAAAFIRQGYIFDENQLPEHHGAVGKSTVTLVRGAPNAHAVQVATEAEAHATAMQELSFKKEVEAAAKQMIEQAAADEKQKQKAAQIAEAKKVLRQLEASA